MKIIKYSLLICLLAIFAKCSPDDGGVFGETIDRTDQLVGTWKMKTAYEIDIDAEKKNFPEFATKINITDVVNNMPFSDFQMTIAAGTITTVNGNSPMAYVIDEGNGTWQWISDSEVELVSQQLGINASKGIKASINNKDVEFLITSYAGISGSTPMLFLTYIRKDTAGNQVTKYEYSLEKQ